ncbi:MAG: two pore domain potassium channel family protein [Ruminococcaceae bacterium]|nr:two pore domain potassium channel family protein [Oscillospiraceae bacterium]
MKRNGFRRGITVLKHTGAICILWSFLVFLCIAAFLLMLIEPQIKTYGDGLWYCFVASATIGFGDICVVTTIGRMITMILAVYGIMVTAMVPGVVFTYYMEYVKIQEKQTISMFLEKLESLPELSKEELEELSLRVKNFKNGSG